MSAVADRKRLPLIRPICPVHLIPMVVYAATERCRYHRCVIGDCTCRAKSVKTTNGLPPGYLQAEL